MSQDNTCGSITLVSSRSFKNLEVSQTITFQGLRNQAFEFKSLEHIAINLNEVTLERTDSNTFKLIVDGCVFFEGEAIEVKTKNIPNGLNC